ncbi:MAG: hypothetical protein ABI776_06265 [Nocardioidaceae bacterium]
MHWDDHLGRLFDDLEQQADGLVLRERDAEVAEQRRAEYAQVDLAARLHASVGSRLVVGVTGAGVLDGVLGRVGSDWCLLRSESGEWLLRLSAVGSLRGLADRGAVAGARPVAAGLGFASALRSVAEARRDVLLHRLDGSVMLGSVNRVGADFVEVRVADAGHLETVPFGAVAAVRRG